MNASALVRLDSASVQRDTGSQHRKADSPEHEDIGRLAYALWQQRGSPEESSQKDWIEAEEQLRKSSRQIHLATRSNKMLELNQKVPPTRILIIEDNPADVNFLHDVFNLEPEWNTEFIVVGDGDEAIDYLLYPDTAKPDLVILDLNLPRRDGIDVLKAIRMSNHLYGLRVAIFSSYPEDVIRSKMAQANLEADDYINKPAAFSEFSSLAKRFHQCCDPDLPLRHYSASA